MKGGNKKNYQQQETRSKWKKRSKPEQCLRMRNIFLGRIFPLFYSHYVNMWCRNTTQQLSCVKVKFLMFSIKIYIYFCFHSVGVLAVVVCFILNFRRPRSSFRWMNFDRFSKTKQVLRISDEECKRLVLIFVVIIAAGWESCEIRLQSFELCVHDCIKYNNSKMVLNTLLLAESNARYFYTSYEYMWIEAAKQTTKEKRMREKKTLQWLMLYLII